MIRQAGNVAGPMAQPSTYVTVVVVSAAGGVAIVPGGMTAAAGALEDASIAAEAYANSIPGASTVIPDGLTQGVLDAAQGASPGPSVGSRITVIVNLIGAGFGG